MLLIKNLSVEKFACEKISAQKYFSVSYNPKHSNNKERNNIMASDDVSRLELLLREHFARTDKQLSDMRAENAEFHVQIMKDFSDFAEKQNAKFEAFTEKQDVKFDAFTKEIRKDIGELKAEVVELRRDVTGLQHDVAGLYHWNYWTLAIIIALLAMPQILTGIKALIGAAADAVSAVARIFRREDKA